MSTAPLLQALSFPLHGSRLVEASAGTGKTFTIATLVLRLVLGHGGVHAFRRPLMPPEILVVTFTEAAAKELRDRIRQRLTEAAAAFEPPPAERHDEHPQRPQRPPGEDVLGDLRASFAPADWPAHARTLRLAAEWMDEAAVSTIHSWCQRMLREHAFDSDSLFLQTLQTDESALQDEAVRDWWRHFLYPLDEAQAAMVAGWWATPEDLRQGLTALLPWAETLAEHGMPSEPAHALQAAAEEAALQLQALKAPWRTWADELQGLIEQAADQKRLAKGRFRTDALRWLGALRAWAQDETLTPFPDKSKAWERLSPAELWAQWTDGLPPQHSGPEALKALQGQLKSLPNARTALLRHAAVWCAQRLAQEKARQAVMGYQDLLARLDAALRGPNGATLAARIRHQFPVALIDEFQDTDALQLRIFDTVYGVQRNDPATALVLIGDPKQSIYSFRGASIHTYLATRRHTQGRHATLGTNFRSTAGMVHAVNHVFGQAEGRAQGAFGYRMQDGPGPGENLLPFQSVEARGRSERWQVGGRPDTPALTFWHVEAGETMGSERHREHMAERCARDMVRLLHAGRQQQAGFVGSEGLQRGVLRAVQPGDMAVLVNSGREALAVRAALDRLGVRSVYLSDQRSVYRSPMAAELQRWLAACAAPGDERLLRAALATPALGLSWAELDALRRDDAAWEQRLQQCHACHETWQRQGVLPMLRRWIHEHGVATRLLRLDRERDLTDLLHLAELLQQASTRLDGPQALLRHLAERRQDDTDADDGRRVRLESDEQLVKVVTVHKSKGLEYPLVFLPFASACRPVKATDAPPFVLHGAQHPEARQDATTSLAPAAAPQVLLSADADTLAQLDAERQREDLRKLYVALTRARFATWVGAAPVKGLEASALGHLLGGAEVLARFGLKGALQRLQGAEAQITIDTERDMSSEGAQAPAGAQDVPRWRPQVPPLVWRPEPALPARPAEPWGFTSYSAMLHGLGADDAASATASAQAATFLEEVTEVLKPGVPGRVQAAGDGLLHDFPRGAGPGSFLHSLLEWAGQEGFETAAAQGAELRVPVQRRCEQAGHGPWASRLQDWLAQWLVTPLPLGTAGDALCSVAPQAMRSVKVEMEFWCPAPQVALRRLDELVRHHCLPGEPRPALSASTLNGMLKGFIDLVFEHEGRYFVADHKSNWLGATDADYTPQRMRQVMLDKRYDLQAVLYVFALHRLLRSRLAGYDYEQHMGGAAYLFLRGHAAPGQGVHMERPPLALIEALDRMFSPARA
jgi:exodeoxyribonuclease V beta subunit